MFQAYDPSSEARLGSQPSGKTGGPGFEADIIRESDEASDAAGILMASMLDVPIKRRLPPETPSLAATLA